MRRSSGSSSGRRIRCCSRENGGGKGNAMARCGPALRTPAETAPSCSCACFPMVDSLPTLLVGLPLYIPEVLRAFECSGGGNWVCSAAGIRGNHERFALCPFESCTAPIVRLSCAQGRE